ncbi:ParB N-terminal domain-containing protein [Undibacterium sp. MH2W]|uniref:ParB N-terminal domain-containing protein n=1 Tax=Undibacterium sp. MH2W TaxID=3413044 RepID=UPI003BF09D1A
MNEVFELIAVEKLMPHENVDQEAADELHQKLLRENKWTNPLVVSREGLVILDGHHRFEIAKRLHLRRVPAYLIDYHSTSVELRKWGTDDDLDKQIVLDAAKTKQMFPPKSTHHTFPKTLRQTNISLSLLR